MLTVTCTWSNMLTSAAKAPKSGMVINQEQARGYHFNLTRPVILDNYYPIIIFVLDNYDIICLQDVNKGWNERLTASRFG